MEIWKRIKFAFQWNSISLLTDVKLVGYVRWLNDIKISCVLFFFMVKTRFKWHDLTCLTYVHLF